MKLTIDKKFLREINLSKCYTLKQADLKTILKHYTKNLRQLITVNMNFCLNITWPNIFKPQSFESLTHLFTMSINISTSDLLELVNINHLEEIAFTLPSSFNKKENLIGFNKIKRISMEVRPNLNMSVLIDLLDSFLDCQVIEIFARQKVTLILSFDNLENKFERLTTFIGSGQLYLNPRSALDIINRCEMFHLNIENLYYAHSQLLFQVDKLQEINKKFGLTNFEYLSMQDSSDIQSEHMAEEDAFASRICQNVFLRELCFLKRLDLRQIHIHGAESVCQVLAHLKRMHFFLEYFTFG